MKGTGDCTARPTLTIESDIVVPKKYPRTPHLPWSPGFTADDIHHDPKNLPWVGKDVVITEKIDGEVTCLSRDSCHARSPSSGYHPSRTIIKSMWSAIRYDIEPGFRLYGENIFATHSVKYTELPAYFVLFAVSNDKDEWLSWEETQEWADLLDLKTPPVLSQGTWDEEKAKACWPRPSSYGSPVAEGYVVRSAAGFAREDFGKNLGKFVHADFTAGIEGHWMSKPVEKNGLAI